jgi:hypothetical protein
MLLDLAENLRKTQRSYEKESILSTNSRSASGARHRGDPRTLSGSAGNTHVAELRFPPIVVEADIRS